jgi:hypothetical protein
LYDSDKASRLSVPGTLKKPSVIHSKTGLYINDE